ncbi:unnamed protein product [Arabidopsis thaliana]|uniref:(thale cress) hypothetical protein n=1 Tax=Arabidopsis thaliana TaxID=3702 RepID=A0A7G2DZN0_ARATH|nr:unnamed protein product [Arabidopsis thaliana]
MRNWEDPFTLACNTALKKNLPSCIFLIIFISVLCPVAMSQVVVPDSDADCLLRFKDTLANGSEFRSWDPLSSPCQGNTANWFGVLCSNYVWGLQLEGMGLTGKLNLDPLVPMKNLRTISFMNNNFNGPMPQVKRFTSLKSLYLSNNRFSGEIPADAFLGMPLLKKILLANNAFRGTIPSSLASLPMLLELRLNGNQFQGQIPSFQQKDLKLASFENNDLDGPIPESLRNMDPGSFAGNKGLCDAPLSPCSSSSPGVPVVPVSPVDPKSTSPPTGKKAGSFYTLAIILIVIGIILVIIALVFCFVQSRRLTEFIPNSSLASHLHANNSAGLDWITRLKIIKGVAKGLSYLFDELPTLTIPHGHMKSSNIVLDDSFEPLLTDYALRPVMSSEHAHNFMTAYKSPEYRPSKGQIITKKTDVWCFGVLILEVLTGRFPENYLTQGYDSNMSLVTWVNDMVKEKKTGDVFDKEMKGKKNCKAEMINLLKIGLRCCEEEEERRMDMREVVEMVEMLREGESEDDFGSMDHRGTHNNVYSSMLLDDDDFGFSMNR